MVDAEEKIILKNLSPLTMSIMHSLTDSFAQESTYYSESYVCSV